MSATVYDHVVAPEPSSTAPKRRAEYAFAEFVRARDASDTEAARRWWDELVTHRVDLVRTLVVTRSQGVLYTDSEREEAVSRALLRITTNFFTTFAGTTMGEWVNAVVTLTNGICLDVQRAATVRSNKEKRPFEHDAQTGHEDPAMTRAAVEHWRTAEEQADADADLLAAREFLDWALPRLSDKRRGVIEADLEGGLSAEQIQERLGMTRDAVYQARKRGMDDLRRLAGEYRR